MIATDTAHTEVVLLAVMAAVAGLVVVSHFVETPYPILLVLGGLGLGFVPGMPDLRLDPDLVFLIFLPPLLYSAAFFSSLRDLRANVRPISLLSIGLVLATTVGVAVIAHVAIAGMSWEVAFVLGAIVSPTDPTAATAIASRLGVPRRIVTIVEGESLINDGTGLVVYKVAVVAVVSGSFSLVGAGLEFAVGAAGGVAIGLVVGWLIAQVRGRIENPPVEIAISLVTAYFAYIPAEIAGVSGVLAAVAAGIYLGWHAPQLINPTTRLQSFAVWEVLVFVMNSVLFVLVGLQLPHVLEAIEGRSTAELAGYAALVSAAVIAIRIAWVFALTHLPRMLFRRVRERDPTPPWQNVFLVGWNGMRGAVSLAAALALPLETDAGAPFPERDLVVFLAFSVIFATLVLQGLSLPPLIRALGVTGDGAEHGEEAEARLRAAEAAMSRIEELAGESWVRDDTAERMRNLYDYRRRRFAARFDDGDDGGYEERSEAFQRLRAELIEAERRALLELRDGGRISDDVMHRVERDLDLEHSRLEL